MKMGEKPSYEDFEKALDLLGVVAKTDKKSLRRLYLSLSRDLHPDAINGSVKKFQELNDAYRLILSYIDNYRFQFDKEEFERQYPNTSDWLSGR